MLLTKVLAQLPRCPALTVIAMAEPDVLIHVYTADEAIGTRLQR
jgi:hypothetical protein